MASVHINVTCKTSIWTKLLMAVPTEWMYRIVKSKPCGYMYVNGKKSKLATIQELRCQSQ